MRALILTDSGALVAANLSYAVVGLITGVATARTLGAHGRGELAIVVFWPTLLSALADVGVGEAITLRVARRAADLRAALVAGVLLAGVLSAVVAGVGWLGLWYLLRADQLELLGLARRCLWLIPANLASLIPQGALLGLGHYRVVALARTLSVVSYLVAVLVAVAWGAEEVAAFAWLTVLSRALPLPIAGAMLLRLRWGDLGALRVGAQASEGTRLHAARIATLASGMEDRALANWTLGHANIGHWNVVSTLASLFPFVGQGISQQLFASLPRVARVKRRGLVATAYVRAVMLSGALAAVALPVLPVLVPALFGKEFRAAVAPSMVVAVASVFGAGVNALQAGARALECNRTVVEAEVAGILAMALLAWPAVSIGGLWGLAWTYTGGKVTCLSWMVLRRRVWLGCDAPELIPGSDGFRRVCLEEVQRLRRRVLGGT